MGLLFLHCHSHVYITVMMAYKHVSERNQNAVAKIDTNKCTTIFVTRTRLFFSLFSFEYSRNSLTRNLLWCVIQLQGSWNFTKRSRKVRSCFLLNIHFSRQCIFILESLILYLYLEFWLYVLFLPNIYKKVDIMRKIESLCAHILITILDLFSLPHSQISQRFH